jgi:hypothetical protein
MYTRRPALFLQDWVFDSLSDRKKNMLGNLDRLTRRMFPIIHREQVERNIIELFRAGELPELPRGNRRKTHPHCETYSEWFAVF